MPVDRAPDMLVQYVRKRMKRGIPSTFRMSGRQVWIIPTSILPETTIPGILVMLDAGASVTIAPDTPLNPHTFVAGGFRLHQAVFLASLFSGIRANHTVLGDTTDDQDTLPVAQG